MKQAFSFFQTSRQLVWRKYFPALFFLAGFVWDALTIGRQVQQTDLIILSSYLVAAATILWWLAHQTTQASLDAPEDSAKTIVRLLPQAWREPAPYFLLQFLYGSLLSALFILYFKSAGHVFAWVWALLLAAILIGNEFLERHYQQNTVAWTMFGFCAILLFNFVLPCLFGSIHWAWFVLSTIAGAGLTHVFYYKSKEHVTHPLTHIAPTWILACLLLAAYFTDVIPPVPLVKLDAVVGVELEKAGGQYRVEVDAPEWWEVWRLFSDDVYIKAGERVFCVTAVFAPQGLHARLYHRWQFYNGKNWITTSRIGFALSGGRLAGFRGYTYKQNLQAGDWRVAVETEDAHTVSVDEFTIVLVTADNTISRKQQPI